MKAYSTRIILILISFIFIFSLIACSPKRVIRGRVVDADTREPIKGAAVAIKWYTDVSGQQIEDVKTVDARQALSDDRGVFKIPEYPDKKYVLGVYKNGYICWSNQGDFSNHPGVAARQKKPGKRDHQIKDGMEIELSPFKKEHSKNLHAGFAVLVAGESTNRPDGPFHQAIEHEYQMWRENLRKDFQKQLGVK
jgi:hypothetical protein